MIFNSVVFIIFFLRMWFIWLLAYLILCCFVRCECLLLISVCLYNSIVLVCLVDVWFIWSLGVTLDVWCVGLLVVVIVV